MTLGLRSISTPLALCSLLVLGAAGCGSIDKSDDTAASGATSGYEPCGTSGCTEGAGYTSGYEPCGTAGCNSSGWDPCGTGGCYTSGSYTSGYTSGWATDGPTDGASGGNDGPLITTGNEDATEWDVTVRHTLDGEAPVEGTYLTTTLIHMETDFYSVTAVPVGLGSTIYVYVDGDHAGGTVTNLEGGFVPISVEGTIQISDVLLDGSGTLHDEDSGEQVGTWEILDAVPHP